MLSGTAGASYPGPTVGPDGSPMPSALANQPMVLHVNDHGTWKVLTNHPTRETVNGKPAAVVTPADFQLPSSKLRFTPTSTLPASALVPGQRREPPRGAAPSRLI